MISTVQALQLGLQAVILDWAGTTVDYGCVAPAEAFVRLFERWNVSIDLAEARAPMGLGKRDHIRSILISKAVAPRWEQAYARPWTEYDLDGMYNDFQPLVRQSIAAHTDLIPGVVEVVAALRARGLRIGSTTGYTRDMMQCILPEAARQGYAPDAMVCIDEVPAGRPAPWMALDNMRTLRVYPPSSIIKIGDTLPDIAEGRNAGMWRIGVIKTGNEIGLSQAEVEQFDPADYQQRCDSVHARMIQAGADYVVDTLSYVLPILDTIQRRLTRGERP